jgi:hypothetical protein
MSNFPGINLLSIIEPALLGVTWCVFMRHRAYRRFPAFCAYLSCRLGVYVVLSLVLRATHLGLIDKYVAYTTYYYIFWLGYLAGAAMAFLVIQSVFSRLIEPFPGLHRLGLIGFRWATATSVLIAVVMAIFPADLNQDILIEATSGVMRCMSILELCLLALILFSMQTVRLSAKSWEFGIALGLAMIASAELAASAFAFGHSTMASVANYASQIVVTLAAAVWAVYFSRPAVERAAFRLPQSSPLRRWNEVASALTEPAPQIALGAAPVNTFFLQDVEKAVDKVMERNAMYSGE